jgi:hypothetical protein
MGSPLTAPTAMVCVATADENVLVVVLYVVSAKARLSKPVKNTTTMLSNIPTLFLIT